MFKTSIQSTLFWSVKKNSLIDLSECLGDYSTRFCFHHKLKVGGNCRLCLVEIVRSPKPQPSCALPFIPSTKLFFNTPFINKAKANILEFTLVNHPLDCPICDQGGECDLQEQNIHYGSEISRFYYTKKSLVDIFWGTIVKTIMHRCIVCTRCVRFIKEFIGSKLVGTIKRSKNSEISNFIEKSLSLELAGGTVDLCPVGSLMETVIRLWGKLRSHVRRLWPYVVTCLKVAGSCIKRIYKKSRRFTRRFVGRVRLKRKAHLATNRFLPGVKPVIREELEKSLTLLEQEAWLAFYEKKSETEGVQLVRHKVEKNSPSRLRYSGGGKISTVYVCTKVQHNQATTVGPTAPRLVWFAQDAVYIPPCSRGSFRTDRVLLKAVQTGAPMQY
uniref:NADH dehydrogenase subunit 11 n=1 Tax=Ishige okamurae TaxID=233772 RepID=UPI002E784573|nr:NADH dehydrogenase subunit 11 [Ishige okamurae]WBP70214.1 NADH dehydrogenase subunit 11 [Ishige okamurae]